MGAKGADKENIISPVREKYRSMIPLLKPGFQRNGETRNVDRVTPITSNASFIGLDKDKRIKALEDEIAELQRFQHTESSVEQQERLNVLQSELETKVAEISENVSHMKHSIEAKKLAEQKMVSIEYEYEQHKERAGIREKELVDELESLRNDIRTLKEELKAMTEKANSFEAQLLVDENKHTAKVETIKQLQKDFDDMSKQMMKYVETNEQLKKRCDSQSAELGLG